MSERNDLEVEKLVFEKAKAKRSIYSLAFSNEVESRAQQREQHQPGSLQLEVLDTSMDMAEAAADRIVASKPGNAATPRTLHIQKVTSQERELEEEVKNLNSALEVIWAVGDGNAGSGDLRPTPAPPMMVANGEVKDENDDVSFDSGVPAHDAVLEIARHEKTTAAPSASSTRKIGNEATLGESNVTSRRRRQRDQRRSSSSSSSSSSSLYVVNKATNKALQRKASLVTSLHKMDAKLVAPGSRSRRKGGSSSSLMRPTASSIRKRASAILKSRKAYKNNKRKRTSRGTARGRSVPPSSRFGGTPTRTQGGSLCDIFLFLVLPSSLLPPSPFPPIHPPSLRP